MLGKRISSSSSSSKGSRSGSSNVNTTSTVSLSSSSTAKHSTVKPIVNLPESPESTQTIPHIKTQDNSKLLPKYTTALTKPQDDFLPAEDLDAIQLELEMLLSTVSLRYRLLKTEYDTLDKADTSREKKGKYMDKQPNSPGKRKRIDEKNIKSKDSKLFGNQLKIAKLKNSSNSPVPSQNTDESMDGMTGSNQKDNLNKPLINKNDTPNKFWLSVEPYCMPITQEDIKLLNDLIDEYSGAIVPPIPDLGPHYSGQWATDDLKDEQDNSNPSKSHKRINQFHGTDVMNMLKKGEKLMGENVTGPLTQRLVSALLDENLMQDNITSAENSNSGSENMSNNSSSNRSTLSLMKNGISIERRVRKELIEQGLLDPEDFGKSQQDDEILSEIKRVRTELTAIAEYNCNELKKIQNLAKEEMKRLEIKRKLDIVDQDIIEMYKKVMAAKVKRRKLTQQERDEIFQLTEKQKELSDQLETLPMPGPNYVGA